MQYNIDELVKASNVSQRSIYTYIQRRLIPPAIKDGKGFIYTDEHLETLRIVRVLVKLGLPLRQIEGFVVGRERGEILKTVAPVLPLIKLLEDTDNRVAKLQRKALAPDPEELDLDNLGLEDPVSLKHKLAEAERQQDRLKGEFEIAGTEVIRELVSSSSIRTVYSSSAANSTSDNNIVQLLLQFRIFEERISRQLAEIQAGIEQLRHESEQSAFIAGLVAAHNAGWQADPMAMRPIALDSKFVDAFQAFIKSQRGARS